MKKFKLFITVVLFILLAVCILIVKNIIIEKKFNYNIEQVLEYNYFVFLDDSKYGVIDSSGNTIVKAEYQSIIIPNPQKDVFVCYTNNSITVLNSKNEELFQKYDAVEPIKLKNLASPLCYEKSVLKYKKDNLYGLIDFNGKEITKALYNSIENLQPVEGKLLVEQNDKFGVLDIKGNLIVKPIFYNITSDEFYTENDFYKKSGFIVSNKNNDGILYGYYSYTGKKVLSLNYNNIERVSLDENKNVYLIASINGKYGVYKNYKAIIKNDYQSISYDDNSNLFFVEKNKKFGAISLAGKKKIDIKNTTIESRGMYIYTKIDDKSQVYDTDGKIVDINYNKTIYNTENEEYKISTLLNNEITYYGIMNKNGTQLLEDKYMYLEYLYENYFIAKDDSGHLGIIDTTGKVFLNLTYDSVQKIKGKNLIQAITPEKTTEIYSKNFKKICSLENANINNQSNYVLIFNDLERIYLDENGNEIKDESKIKNLDFPEYIGSYKKMQVTLEAVYYVK